MKEIEIQNEYINKVKEINNNKSLKYIIITMGCKLNENDSEKLSGMLEKMNYIKTENINCADFIIFNTCCVRENAEEKLLGKLGMVKEIKEKRNAIIAISGCMMQEEHIVQKINKSFSFVDIIIGTHTLHKLPEDTYNTIKNKQKIRDILDIDGKIYEGLPIKRESDKSASVTIMYGCNNFCSYCIVPYVRGRERSREPKVIIEEIIALAKEGYKEITLLGQNVNSYKGNNEIKNFAELLNKIDKIDGIESIKFLSPHPKDFTDDVINSIKNSKKINRTIHLPLQSGSTNVLKVMNRKYSKEQYLSLVEKMRKEIANVSFTTDIIVGFPGETEEDFENTLDVIKKVNYEQIFMFIYSRRIGTPADKMENQISEDIKHKRFERLQQLVKEQTQINNEKYIGTTHKILVEGKSKNNENYLSGRTTTNKVVIFEGNEELIGKIVNIEINSNHLWYLKGIIKE